MGVDGSMTKLQHVVVADPTESVAAEIARYCTAFAASTATATTIEQAFSVTQNARPEMAIVALELLGPDAAKTLAWLRSAQPTACIVLTFRELAVSTFGELRQLNIADVLPQPVDPSGLLRIAWQRFNISTRRYERFPVELDVFLPDGVLLGRTHNVSEGGLLMDVKQPIAGGDSILVDVNLPQDKPLRVRVRVLAAEGEVPTPMWARLQFENLRGPAQKRLIDFLAQIRAPDTKSG